ncbi:hypothetical protein [Mesorhizobium amorphae]|uniref:hypothetical protein n=1 Tax=Mesorhizobium amorphae TaxID=71433 RepID=UPI000B6A457E|nr:hypothetical protein [Mesorhizobium amorphae]OWK21738.1 hypothetical protein AJ88_11150 [Mesorhizobium amorphae CCBAU 01583]
MDEDAQDHTPKVREAMARSLAAETGISFDQARDLIALIGTNRSSLLREARILKKRSGQSLP